MIEAVILAPSDVSFVNVTVCGTRPRLILNGVGPRLDAFWIVSGVPKESPDTLFPSMDSVFGTRPEKFKSKFCTRFKATPKNTSRISSVNLLSGGPCSSISWKGKPTKPFNSSTRSPLMVTIGSLFPVPEMVPAPELLLIGVHSGESEGHFRKGYVL